MAPLIVDDEPKLKPLLSHLTKRIVEGYLIFADTEGVDLG